MLWAPVSGFTWSASNIDSTRPTTPIGTSVTPGNNTYGSYAQVLSGIARDAYGIWVQFNTIAVSGSAKDCIATIGIDPAGGSSYTDTIQHLLCSSATTLLNGGLPSYYFPLYIKAGSTVACKMSVNNATVGTGRCIARVFGSPIDQRLVRAGSYVETIGATPASSAGTSITSGTTSEGSWTSLGATTKETWWAQGGFGINNATMAALLYHADFASGDGSNKDLLIADMKIYTSTAEMCDWQNLPSTNARPIPGGTNIYGRLQCSGTPDSGIALAAYMLGG